MNDAEIIASVAGDLPVGVWVARAPRGEFVYANKLFGEIMGMTARSDVAAGAYAQPYGIHDKTGRLYPEDQLPFARVLRSGALEIVDDIVIHRSDGGRVHIRAQARPVYEAGTLSHVVIAFIDISREVEAEERLRLAQRMEAIGNLAGGVAHDFNNLLAVVKLIASTLIRDEQDPRRKEGLLHIEQAADSAVGLTRALLDFARRGESRKGRVSLNEVVRGLSQIVRRALGGRIEVEIDLRSAADQLVGDRSQLEQVVMNLVVNARDAIGESGTLALSTRDEGADVILEVEDSGTGIAEEVRARIFEPYFTTRTQGAVLGTGLGLATVFGIVQGHGGSIEALDHQPRGTRMRVRFPRAPAQAAEEPVASAPREPTRGSGLVLLVDDEPLVRTHLERALRKLGYDVLAAASGAEAVALFPQARPAAVILDLAMPGMDGRETFLALRALDPAVRALLSTGSAVDERVQGILALGVREVLAKPYDLTALSEALAKVLG